ncbi:MAG: hypothetical protein HYV26_18545 [Candidatus Hydrogenedentes bacterium]|nr:hypothetical protein [Candidatus Hydrogenedentota bacterium]
MNLQSTVFYTLPLLLCLACASGNGPSLAVPEAPSGWKRVDLGNGNVSFALPAGVEETETQGTEGVVRQYQGAELQINVHYGDFASTLAEFQNVSQGVTEWLEIGGKRARGTSAMIDGRAVDGVYFPDPGPGTERFSLVAVSTTPAARAQAMAVLRSVQFK